MRGENSRACISRENRAVRILCCEEMKVSGQKASNNVKEKHKGIDKGGKKSIFQARFVRSRRADGSGDSGGVFIRHQLWWGTPAGPGFWRARALKKLRNRSSRSPGPLKPSLTAHVEAVSSSPGPRLSSFLYNGLLSPVSEDLCFFSLLNRVPERLYFRHFF